MVFWCEVVMRTIAVALPYLKKDSERFADELSVATMMPIDKMTVTKECKYKTPL